MTSDIGGKWYNQHGSELEITVDGEGRIRGVFRSGIGFPKADEQFEVVGVVTGDLVAFVVSFGKYDCITSWTGHAGMEKGEPVIYALWHMSVGLPPGCESELWQGMWSGADTFVRTATEREKDRRRAKPSHPTSSGGVVPT